MGIKPFDGAETLLAGLAEAGIQAGVVSNKIGAFLRDEATALGWTGYFTHLVGAGDAEADKPHPAPVRAALAGGVPGPDVWFVGDSPIVMECAVKAGCTGILMRPHPPKPGEFDAFPPHRVFDSCAGLLAAVRGGRP